MNKAAWWILLTLIASAGAQGQSLEDETVSRLADYLRVDTINPPGNESNAVDFFAKLLDAEGIPYDSAESAPGRGNLWARLEGGARLLRIEGSFPRVGMERDFDEHPLVDDHGHQACGEESHQLPSGGGGIVPFVKSTV